MTATAASRAAPTAWLVLGAGVVAYEAWCLHRGRPDDLLTRGVARARSRSRTVGVLVDTAICTTAAHLLGVLPESVDPFAALLTVGRVVLTSTAPEPI